MEKGYGQGDSAIAGWAVATFDPEDAVLREIRERSLANRMPDIQVAAMDGRLLELLARASGARRAVEIGTLGGYSGVCLLRGMGPGGRLDTFEISETHAAVARESFRRAGLEAQARVHVGPALERLRDVEAEAPFDLCFIDADKVNYPAYLAWAGEHLKISGLVLGDNAFAFGEIARAPSGTGAASTAALQSFALDLARGGRFRSTIIPTAEGLAMGVKIC